MPMGKALANTNRYLKDPALRERMVLKSVASSSAIEGIRAPFNTTERGGTSSVVKFSKKKK